MCNLIIPDDVFDGIIRVVAFAFVRWFLIISVCLCDDFWYMLSTIPLLLLCLFWWARSCRCVEKPSLSIKFLMENLLVYIDCIITCTGVSFCCASRHAVIGFWVMFISSHQYFFLCGYWRECMNIWHVGNVWVVVVYC